jgi:hypothetical protein
MRLLIDGDLISYPCAAASEGTEAWVANSRADETVSRILHETNATEYQIYLGGQGNHRYSIYALYKANRTKPKPTFLESVREHLLVNWNAKLVNEIETDDRLGIEQCTAPPRTTMIASFDKDLLMIPGRHYNWKRQVFKDVSIHQGLQTLYKQAIAGDGADNIPGYDTKTRQTIPKFIERLQAPIDDMIYEKEMYDYCVDLYTQQDNLDSLHRNISLLYILQEEGKFWQPPV